MTDQSIRQVVSTAKSVAAERMSDMHRSASPAGPLPPTVVNLTRDAVQAGIGAAAAYDAFLKAIAARSFDDICDLATDRLRTDLRKMRECPDFPALFGMWCESYPPTAKSVPAHGDENTAILDIDGDVAGGRVRARVLLRRFDGQWLVDREHFRT